MATGPPKRAASDRPSPRGLGPKLLPRGLLKLSGALLMAAALTDCAGCADHSGRERRHRHVVAKAINIQHRVMMAEHPTHSERTPWWRMFANLIGGPR